MQDKLGNPVNSSADALPGINDFVGGFIRFEPDVMHVLQTSEKIPDDALANIYSGCLWMMLEQPDALDKARSFLQTSTRLVGDARPDGRGASLREWLLTKLLRHWVSLDRPAMISTVETLITAFPQDLLAVKLALIFHFNAGNAPAMLRLAVSVLDHNRDHAEMHALLAFAEEECHRLQAARESAERALSIRADEPWAHHCLAHVHLARAETREGLAFLKSVSDHWAGLNSFMYTHNWWHVALFYLGLGDHQAALQIYDKHCWGIDPTYSEDQIGAISLLARLEFVGVDVGERWQSLAGFVEARSEDVGSVFMTLQYLYCLRRVGHQGADSLMAMIRKQPEKPEIAADQNLWQSVGVTAALGVQACAAGRWGEATDCLSTVQTRLWRIGASHAQRDLFNQMLLHALIQDGQWVAVMPILERRLRFEPDNPWIPLQQQRVFDKLQIPPY